MIMSLQPFSIISLRVDDEGSFGMILSDSFIALNSFMSEISDVIMTIKDVTAAYLLATHLPGLDTLVHTALQIPPITSEGIRLG